MPISANSIIHFTKSKEALQGILQDNFKIHYCIEEVDSSDNHFKMAIPMVSFCDITLSQVKVHMDKYGEYGIGLTKEWAIRNGLNPVLYMDKNSMLANSFINFFDDYLKAKTSFNIQEKQFLDLARYTKNYQGDLERNGKIHKDYRFYDEREWRYTLSHNEHENFALPVGDDFDKEEVNQKINEFRLIFEPNDIKYIIIKDEEEINEFINVLRKAKGKNFSMNDVEKLTTRIITSTQIYEDF